MQAGWRSEYDGGEVIYLSTVGHYRAITLNPHALGFCRESLKHFEIAHIYGLYDMLGAATGIFCRRQVILYLVEPIGMFRPIVRHLALKWLYHRVLGDFLIAGARFLIATSEQERQELIEGGIAPPRIPEMASLSRCRCLRAALTK